MNRIEQGAERVTEHLNRLLLIACLAGIASGVLPAMAQLVAPPGPKPMAGEVSTSFKLHARFDDSDLPLLIDGNEAKPHPQVDSGLINQIDQARVLIPGWQGTHNIVPGGVFGSH